MPQRPPIHAYTHLPTGTDPLATGFVVFGEAYKTADQTISDSAYTQLTNWLNWNVPSPATIDQATNGLEIIVDGYYLLHGYIDYAGLASTDTGFFGSFEWGSGEEFVDRMTSTVVRTHAGLQESTDVHWSGVAFIAGGSTVTMWTEQITTPSASRAVTACYMRAVYLCSATSGFPGF